jgi:hypothetical protein
MDKEDCVIGLAVDHSYGKTGIIVDKPWYRAADDEWFIPVLKCNGIKEDMFPRRLTPHKGAKVGFRYGEI